METKIDEVNTPKKGAKIEKFEQSQVYALFIVTAILSFWGIARKNMMLFIDNNIIPILQIDGLLALSENTALNIILCILLVFTVSTIAFFIAKYIYDRAKSFLCSTFAVIMAYYLIYGYEWWQHKSGFSFIQSFDWVDMLHILIILFFCLWLFCSKNFERLISYLKSYICNKQEEYYIEPQLKYDEAINDENDDRLGYQELVQELARKLNNKLPFRSLSIAINGAWGIGKTSFVRLLKDKLKKINSKSVIIEFNPRLSKSQNTIQEDFFALLFSELAIYNSTFYTIGVNYLKTIDVASQGYWWLKFLSFFKRDNRNKEWSKINQAIRAINRPIFICIDDLDRLLGDEIIEVFKIIGGNANFDNTTFIVAFDKEYVQLNLNKIIGSPDNGKLYADKFFIVEQILPRLSRTQIQNLFEELSPKYTFTKELLESINDEILVKYFKTIRDIKHFLNFINIELDELVLRRMLEILIPKDVFLILLLKLKAPSTYDSLYEKTYFDLFENPVLKADLNKENILCYDILSELFKKEKIAEDNSSLVYSTNSYKELPRSISIDNGRWFYSYFVTRDKESKYYINNRIGLIDIASILNSSDYISELNKLVYKNEDGIILPDDKQIKLLDILDHLSLEGNRKMMKKNYLKAYSYLIIYLYSFWGNYNIIDYLKEVLSNENEVPNDYRNYLREILLEFSFRGNQHSIFQGILINFLDGIWIDSNLLLKQSDFLDLAKRSLKLALEGDQEYQHNKHYNLLCACVSEKVNDSYHLDRESCQMVKEIVIKAPEDFANNLIVMGGITLQFLPYFDDVFGGMDQLIDYFKNEYKGMYKVRIQNFIKLYEANGNQEIIVEDKNLFDRMKSKQYDFRGEVQDLKRVKSVKHLLDKGLIKNYEELEGYRRELSKMVKKLSIATIGDLLDQIQEAINKFARR